MTRIPLSIPDSQDSPYLADDNTKSVAWIAVVFAALFLIASAGHVFLLVRTRAWFIWTITFASVGKSPVPRTMQTLSHAVEVLSLIEFAWSTAHPVSTAWLTFGTLVHWFAPTILTIAIIQTFGRAAWHAVISNPPQMTRLWGFLRWNTLFVTIISLLVWSLLCVGSVLAVAAAPDAIVDTENQPLVTAGYGLVKAGLVIQFIVLAMFSLFVWRFRIISKHWDVDNRAGLKRTWTWQRLMVVVLSSLVLLFIRQLYHMVRFFMDWSGLPWLSLIFSSGPCFGEIAAAQHHNIRRANPI
jgi:hypothetical protein